MYKGFGRGTEKFRSVSWTCRIEWVRATPIHDGSLSCISDVFFAGQFFFPARDKKLEPLPRLIGNRRCDIDPVVGERLVHILIFLLILSLFG